MSSAAPGPLGVEFGSQPLAPATAGVELGSHPLAPMMSPTSRPNRIALDIGGVVSKYQEGGHAILSDWFHTQDAEVPRAMLSIREIVRRFGTDNVFIISKAGLKMAQLTKTWLLETMAIDAVTGFNPKNIHFCRKISGSEGKWKIAQKLGITHMIDDQDEALRTTYQTINDSGDPFPPYGQLFHFARSGSGPPPQSQKWQQEDRPPQVISGWLME